MCYPLFMSSFYREWRQGITGWGRFVNWTLVGPVPRLEVGAGAWAREGFWQVK
ncbi:hypothetical protein POTG_01237 [Paenibacillus sp. oral taxon 786 str. D14]|nr:hypothetical protein POTG_01237 [Paenibacillus sp. oral taxon 786 str. D14]